MLDNWHSGQNIVLKRNPDYWGDSRQVEQRRPMSSARTPAVRAAMVATGEADIVPNLAVQDATNPETDFSYLNSETTRCASTRRCRRPTTAACGEAIELAIDREAMIGTVFPPTSIRRRSMVMPTTIGYNHDGRSWPYDPEKALALIDEARADGVPVDNEIRMIGRTSIHAQRHRGDEA